jgi:tetratricopeptide (TPR) repeat protein
MKTRKQKRPGSPAAKPQRQAPAPSLRAWHIAVAALVALVVVFEAYQPALRGPFVFDDMYLPFYSQDFGQRSFYEAIRGVRPLLMFSFWINHQFSGLEPYGYHLLNVLFHFCTSLLVFFIARRLLEWAGTEGAQREWLSAFAGGLFLLHPVQTESVAYIASRSENLSVLFFYSAFALFLYRRSAAISWRVTLGILILFAAAATTKEHTVALPALLLLTDYFWNPGFSFQGIRRNWRLYVPLLTAGVAGLVLVWRVLSTALTAGFGMKDLPWHHYLFTQWRAVWVYLRLFLFPTGQNADYDYEVSRTVFEHGAIAGLIGLLLLISCAVYFRRRYPLASYGFLAALLLLAPTSSFIPIQDAVAERRLYLPMIGLLLVVLEFVRRWKASRPALAATLAVVLMAAGFLTYQRSKVWSSEAVLWQDVLRKSPENARAHFHLAVVNYEQGRCDVAIQHYETIAKLKPVDYRTLLDWALAEDCLNRPEAALEKLRRAAEFRKTAHVYSQIGMIYAKQKKIDQALAALNTAIEINPRFDMTYVYRGNIHIMTNDLEGAVRDYRRALELNPYNQVASRGLARVEARLGGAR